MTNRSAFWRESGERRPTVLVADDNALILEKASALLSTHFDLVGEVTDGRQALGEALRLHPDVVVLDVGMPELTGFQVAAELRRAGSRAKIVMLTMHESDGHVAAALESGAQGYVVKSRMPSDLPSAINHAIAGRLFMPSLTSLLAITPETGAHRHAVQFRINEPGFLNQLSGLFSAALMRGDVVAVVATEATRTGIAQRLVRSGCDLAQAVKRGTYVSMDAATALSQVMVDGRCEATRLSAIAGDLERSRLAASTGHLTVVVETSPLLCLEGHPEAAIELEHQWDELTRGLPFLTVCFYSMECLSERDPELFRSICASHSAVSHAHDI